MSDTKSACLALAVCLSAALLSCGSNSPKSSSASNWLFCESDAECEAEFPGSYCSSESVCVDRDGGPLPAPNGSEAGVATDEPTSPDAGGASELASDAALGDATDLLAEGDASPNDASPNDTSPNDASPNDTGPEGDPSPEGGVNSRPVELPEACALPSAEWLPMAPQPELNSMTRSVAWYDGALHYLGDGVSRTDTSSSTFEYGRFDPCSNTWERKTFPISADLRHLIGWDGSGFAFGPNGFASNVLNTQGLKVMTRLGMRYSVDDEALVPVTEPLGWEQYLLYPEEAAPEPLPMSASYVNGATDGSRAFAWGQPVPSDDDPTPAPRGWMLDAGSRVWREITQQGAPTARRGHVVIAAGNRFIVWGGTAPESNAVRFSDGAFYDPDTDSWEAISSEGAPTPTTTIVPVLFWVADRLVVNPGGSGATYRSSEGWRTIEPLDGTLTNPRRIPTDDGRMLIVAGSRIHVLDVAAATWLDVATPVGGPNVENQPDFFDVIWTGSSLLYWGSSVPQTCEVGPDLPVCDLIHLFLPAGEGVMVRLD